MLLLLPGMIAVHCQFNIVTHAISENGSVLKRIVKIVLININSRYISLYHGGVYIV